MKTPIINALDHSLQNIGQGWDHMSRVGSIREHTPCTVSCYIALDMRTPENRPS